jgi:hypothetical protein
MADEKPKWDCGRVISMDTPTRKQITSPISKFEDSPVFNYINNLSPIQPVKPVHATQTFNSLSFTAIPSVFTSPHISSLKESRFLRRHQSDPSKPEFSLEIENKVHTEGNENSSDHQQMLDLANYVVQSKEYLKHPAKECSEKLAVAIRTINENVGAEECAWENLLYGDVLSNLGVVESPNLAGPLIGRDDETVGPSMSYCTSVVETQPLGAVNSNEICEIENLSTQPGESGDLRAAVDNQDQDIFACISLEGIAADPTKEMDDELVANLDRGKRRRCLVFEKVVCRRKNFNDGSTSHAEVPSNNDERTINNTSSARRILSGFGLHLNSLATTSKDLNTIKHETSGTGGLIISVAGHSLSSGQQPLTDSTVFPSSLETESASAQNQLMLLEDGSQVNEERTQSSPRKKKRRSDNGGESETCKRCNCKKSRCLKLYCECFAAGVYCSEPCSCHDCFNKPINEDTVLTTRKQIESRNPLAFAPKVIRTSDSVIETVHEAIKKTPASARHKRGCNCKKSGCLKKYCECYQGGVGCSINCRCEGCKNAYGKKNGNRVLFGSTEPELEEEMYNGERSIGNSALPKNMINETDHIPIALTPLQFHRPNEQTFSSKSKPPRSGSSASTLYGTQRFGKQSMFQAQSKFDEPFCTVQSDDMPEILQQNGSPVTGVKSLSPNSKRVSSPRCDSSPGKRSSRKSLLRSIPSFPSLTDPKH